MARFHSGLKEENVSPGGDRRGQRRGPESAECGQASMSGWYD